jgi:hypothetical protein
MKLLNFSKWALLLSATLLWMTACESDAIDDGNNPNNGNNPVRPTDVEPDEIAGLLKLHNASKIPGKMPASGSGQLRINIKDTLYMLPGFPVGDRIVIRHNGHYDVRGFYISVANSSFYYDLPKQEAEAQDSTDVFYFNMEDLEGLDWTYPFSFPISIGPYGPDGIPIKEFVRIVTVEEQDVDGETSITVPKSFSLDSVHWEWRYTLTTDPTGLVTHFEGKGVKKKSEYQTGGCCNDDGTSTTVANDPYCFSKYSDGSPNPRWRTIDVSHFFMWAYDILYLYDDGTFRQANTSMQTNYRPSLSDFCNNDPHYDFDINTFVKFGSHDFAPGTKQIKFTYDVSNPPVFGKNVYGGELAYSSHDILISFVVEGQKWYSKYKRPTQGVSPTTLTLDWE